MAKEKKGLGTGLDALFAANGLDDEDTAGELLVLPITKVEPRSQQPREYFDEEALQTLAESIEQYGLIQPITVREMPGGYYQIIAGERRWRASRLAGLTEVPVRVIEADDRTTAEIALVENLQREDLNPIEEAKGYKTLIDDFGLTQEEAAKSVGRSRPAITNSLRLLALNPEVMKFVEIGSLSAGHAKVLVSLENDEQQLAAAQTVIEKGLSVRKTEQLVNKLLSEPAKEEPADPNVIKVDYAEEVASELTKIMGRKVKLIDGRKTGRIEIEFYGADDRENLIEILRKYGR